MSDDEEVQRIGKEYAESLAAVQRALEPFAGTAPQSLAAAFIASLAREGWLLTRIEDE